MSMFIYHGILANNEASVSDVKQKTKAKQKKNKFNDTCIDHHTLVLVYTKGVQFARKRELACVIC